MPLHLRTRLALTLALSAFLWSARSGLTAQSAQISPAVTACVATAAPSVPAQNSLRGVANFGQVTPTLFRGGQPTSEGYRELKQMGIETVISFRHEKGENSLERRAVEAQGMRFVSLPWHAWEDPTDQQVSQFLLLLSSNSQSKVYVHCQQGRDRTGTMVAIYRVAVEHWCPASAVAEMKAYHYHHFFFPGLETYVQNLPQRLANDQGLAAAIPASRR
ncbi:MAG TPA: tyrosine-protein phosphatase [Candidatus Solibacter sp.]|nr:tyrosine-protein phosphatase [Candidatus Solibacter sp.]